MRLFLLLVIALATAAGARAADALQAQLDRHVREDVAYWVDEPRLLALLRDKSEERGGLAAEVVAELDARWQEELDAGNGELTDHVLSRFGSKYLAEVALRMDGAYGNVVVLDNRGLVVAASELPDHIFLGDDPVVSTLASRADAEWVQDRAPEAGVLSRVALPLADPETQARIGTLLLDVDVSRVGRMQSIRKGSTRKAPADTVTAAMPDLHGATN